MKRKNIDFIIRIGIVVAEWLAPLLKELIRKSKNGSNKNSRKRENR
jgi:hypothetical protein